MKNQLLIFLKNVFKLIGIMYISIGLKNILQILFGTLFSSETDIKVYKIYSFVESVYSIDFIIKLILLYDFFIFVVLAYFWIYLLLYFIIAKFNNKLWLHISFTFIVFILIITYFDPFHYNILFYIITVILGYLNWWLFKKWLKFG